MYEASAIPESTRQRCTNLVATLCQVVEDFLGKPVTRLDFVTWLAGRVSSNLSDFVVSLSEVGVPIQAFEIEHADRLFAQKDRKRGGIYFTPRTLADRMLAHLGDWDGTVVDISCGSGELLLAALRHGASGVYGVEIEPESALVAATRLAIEFPDADVFIEWGDGLLPRQIEDVGAVVGNPPYLGEKGNREFFQSVRQAYPDLAAIHAARMDLAYFFIARSAAIADGKPLILLTSEYWLQADSAAKLRSYLCELAPPTTLETLGAENFDDAPGHHSLIFVSQAGEPPLFQNGDAWNRGELDVPESHVSLEVLCLDRQGFVSGADRVDGKSCFLRDSVDAAWSGAIRPVLRANLCEANRVFLVAPQTPQVIWIDEELNPDDVDFVSKWLGGARTRLEGRREVQNGSIPWYRLHWPRRREEMVGPKLVVPRRAPEPRFCLDLSASAISSDCTYLVAPPEVEEPVEYLIQLMLALNSPWVSKWLESNGKRKGKMFEFYSTPLRSLPVEPLSDFSERARLGLSQVLETKEAFVDLR